MNNGVFLNQLKEFLLEEVKNGVELSVSDVCGYFETMKQHQEGLVYLSEEADKYNLDFVYERDETQGYTYGKIIIYLYEKTKDSNDYSSKYADYCYEIELLRDDRYWGYCQCEPEDEGYNPIYHCCGNGCDWIAPRVQVKKVENKSHFSFNGYQKDMWKLEKEWDKEFALHEQSVKLEKIKWIENQIKELEERKTKILEEE